MRDESREQGYEATAGALPPRMAEREKIGSVHPKAALPSFELLDAYEKRVRFLLEALKHVAATASALEEEQELLADRLRDLMAKQASLRRTDFDRIMDGLRAHRDVTRRHVHEALARFQAEETVCQRTVRELLQRVAAGLGDIDLDLARQRFRTTFARRDERLMELADRLMAFQCDQEELTATLGQLLARTDQVRPRHLQQTVAALRRRQWARCQPAFLAMKGFERMSDRLLAEWDSFSGAPCAREMEGPSEAEFFAGTRPRAGAAGPLQSGPSSLRSRGPSDCKRREV